MQRLCLTLRALVVVVLTAATAVAADEKPAAAKLAAAKADGVFSFPQQVQLTDDQKAKLEQLRQEYGPRLADANARVAAVLTSERHKVFAEARKKSQAEGKKGKEAQAAALAALNLSADEQIKLQEAMAARVQLVKEINRIRPADHADGRTAIGAAALASAVVGNASAC